MHGRVKKRKAAQSGPAVEKQKKVLAPTAVCAACRARGTGHAAVPWAVMEQGKPVGDQCAACNSLHQAGFGYLSWQEFINLRSTEDCRFQAKGTQMRDSHCDLFFFFFFLFQGVLFGIWRDTPETPVNLAKGSRISFQGWIGKPGVSESFSPPPGCFQDLVRKSWECQCLHLVMDMNECVLGQPSQHGFVLEVIVFFYILC